MKNVYVFGSNAAGFHGAGDAGFLCRGDYKNTWRNDKWFLTALRYPPGHPLTIGDYAVVGVARGLQTGKLGMSYAIQTIVSPGKRRSVSLDDIQSQLVELAGFAMVTGKLLFRCMSLGEGYAGYTWDEMHGLWTGIDWPENVIVPVAHKEDKKSVLNV